MTGELAALAAAFLWAIASILFAGVGSRIRAVNLNIFKGAIRALAMLIMLILGSIFNLGSLDINSLFSLQQRDFLLLCLSGFIGIGAGDTFYFACLRRIGPQKGLMLESAAPILAALLALLLFGEMLSLLSWAGIALTSAGVVLVIRWSQSSLEYRTTLTGVLFGLLAALCQAAGIVLSRKVLLAGTVEPLASGLIRLTAALSMLLCWQLIRSIFFHRSSQQQHLREAIYIVVSNNLSGKLLLAIGLGTFLAIWLMQLSVALTSAGITQTLLATCPLFGMIIGRLQGYKQPAVVWFGLATGIVGIALLFLR